MWNEVFLQVFTNLDKNELEEKHDRWTFQLITPENIKTGPLSHSKNKNNSCIKYRGQRAKVQFECQVDISIPYSIIIYKNKTNINNIFILQ